MVANQGHRDPQSVVIDIGATNIRFARLTDQGDPGPVVTCPTADFSDLSTALAHFLEIEDGPRPKHLAVAVAGPVHGDHVKLTNIEWQFSIRQLKKDLALDQLAVVNDLEAMALVLPDLASEDKMPIGAEPAKPSSNSPMAVLCPGTGMGIAGMVPRQRGWQPIATEGGHTGLAPLTEREEAVWRQLRARHGRVSVERVLSGPGIAELYTVLESLERKESESLRSEEIVRLALDGADPLAAETMAIFCAWLGDVAGDIALLYVALGGIYLAGDILMSIVEMLKQSQFRQRFENKGRGAAIVKSTPSYLITLKSPVLHGCKYLLDATSLS